MTRTVAEIDGRRYEVRHTGNGSFGCAMCAFQGSCNEYGWPCMEYGGAQRYFVRIDDKEEEP